MTGSRWWTKTIFWGGLAAGALLLVGALGSRAGLWPFNTGFLVGGAGIAIALLAAVWGLGGLWFALRKALRSEVVPLVVGMAVGVVVLVAFAVQLVRLNSVPPIHQVTTDTIDPPTFDAIIALRPPGTNSLAYDPEQPVAGGTTLAEAQRGAWPELVTYRSSLDPEAALERATRVLEEMGLEIVNADAEAGIVEATDTTLWFGFKDDLVVRVRGDGDGASVDVRSISRVGVADLGVNAKRVLRFLDRFAANGGG